MRVLVTGATGTVGRLVVDELTARGLEVRALSRSGRTVGAAEPAAGDLESGEGLAAAMANVDVTVDCANTASTSRAAATRFFETTTRNLTERGSEVGVGHHVVLSIVGIDDVDVGYYVAKRRHEEVALASPVPVTILRATQFHEFAGQILARTKVGPVSFVPRMRSQPVAALSVARALADVVEGDPCSRAADVGGPREEDMVSLARRVAPSTRFVVPIRIPGRGGRAIRAGGLLLGEGGRELGPTFDEWWAGQRRDLAGRDGTAR